MYIKKITYNIQNTLYANKKKNKNKKVQRVQSYKTSVGTAKKNQKYM